jgi:hypothetical protein
MVTQLQFALTERLGVVEARVDKGIVGASLGGYQGENSEGEHGPHHGIRGLR